MKTDKELFSISTDENGITIHIGQTSLSDVPSLKMAESFVSLARAKNWDSDTLLDPTSSRVNLVGSLLIDSLINELEGKG